jgi:hypothetical protein
VLPHFQALRTNALRVTLRREHPFFAQSVPIDPTLPQLLQHCVRVLQVARVETFGEPAVDRGEEVARFGALALG